MLHWVDLFFVGAEHLPRIGERSSQLLERRLHLFEACLIPMSDFKRAGPFLAESDLILQSVDLPDVFLVRKINKETDYDNGIARANHLSRQGVSARAVIGSRGVLILIDDLHPHEALAGVRQRNRHRSRIEVDNRKRIQRVTVGADNALLDRRSKFAAMPEFSETTVLDHPGEINIGLGAVVVFDGDGLGGRSGRLCGCDGTRYYQ
jgi:hypothetical protein